LPITHSPPADPADAIEIPAARNGASDWTRAILYCFDGKQRLSGQGQCATHGHETGYLGPLPPALFEKSNAGLSRWREDNVIERRHGVSSGRAAVTPMCRLSA